jgi:hypothetical protein
VLGRRTRRSGHRDTRQQRVLPDDVADQRRREDDRQAHKPLDTERRVDAHCIENVADDRALVTDPELVSENLVEIVDRVLQQLHDADAGSGHDRLMDESVPLVEPVGHLLAGEPIPTTEDVLDRRPDQLHLIVGVRGGAY